MQKIGNQLYSYGNRKSSSSSIAIEGKLSPKEEDAILDSYPQLVDGSFRGWFAIRLREVGKKKFVELAERAVKYGRNPQKMFVHLLK